MLPRLPGSTCCLTNMKKDSHPGVALSRCTGMVGIYDLKLMQLVDLVDLVVLVDLVRKKS